MSLADLAPHVTAVIAVIGTLLGGVVAGVFALLQMKGTQRAQKRDTWIKAYDEQRRLLWAERKVAYAQLLNDAQSINSAIHMFDLVDEAAAARPDEPDARNNLYGRALTTLDDRVSRGADSYWRVFTFGQEPVIDAAMKLNDLQTNAAKAIKERQPYDDVRGLYKCFSELTMAVRKGLTGVPDAMKDGLKGTGIDSLYGIA